MNYVCPVCGYSQLEHPPVDFTICPSCGTEFELDDEIRTHDQLREAWLDAGAPWFSATVRPPASWQEYRGWQLMSHHGRDVDDNVGTVQLGDEQLRSIELAMV